jgi:hypothetical protein
MDDKPIVPGSAARSAEQEPRSPARKIEPGSAARISEESESSAVPREAFRASMSIRTRASSGAKFEFAKPQGPGEALPEGYKPPQAVAKDVVGPDSGNSTAGSGGESSTGGTWAGRFRKLFRR